MMINIISRSQILRHQISLGLGVAGRTKVNDLVNVDISLKVIICRMKCIQKCYFGHNRIRH